MPNTFFWKSPTLKATFTAARIVRPERICYKTVDMVGQGPAVRTPTLEISPIFHCSRRAVEAGREPMSYCRRVGLVATSGAEAVLRRLVD